MTPQKALSWGLRGAEPPKNTPLRAGGARQGTAAPGTRQPRGSSAGSALAQHHHELFHHRKIWTKTTPGAAAPGGWGRAWPSPIIFKSTWAINRHTNSSRESSSGRDTAPRDGQYLSRLRCPQPQPRCPPRATGALHRHICCWGGEGMSPLRGTGGVGGQIEKASAQGGQGVLGYQLICPR